MADKTLGDKTLLIRADASPAIGSGHAMRCLALAQAWQDTGGSAVFAMAESTPAIREKLLSESCEVISIPAVVGSEDAQIIAALAQERGVQWIVVDSYQFGVDYQRALKTAGFKTLFLDDYGHAGSYCADLVLNQNVGVTEGLYPDRAPQTRLLLGPRFSLLRREFSVWKNWEREIPPRAGRALVTMGGSDPENVTATVVEALCRIQLEGIESVIVVGGSNPRFNSLQELARKASQQFAAKIRVQKDVSNMPELMAWADVAISAAGSTCWELCLLGLPTLLVDVAKNQTAVARELGHRQCAIHLGGPRDFTVEQLAEQLDKLLRSGETRHALSIRSRKLVDGRGATRVASAMRVELRLRPAQENDCRLLWEWANDPQVRAAAFSQAPILWEQHKVWFASKMKDSNCRMLVAEDGKGRAVGQFRVDWRSDGDGEIDVSLSPECRGLRYGARLIDLGVSSVFAERGECLHALVKMDNQVSQRAFEQAGFVSLGEESVHGHRVVHYAYAKESITT
jgi:UDP-2,4-diacetamido-2,4,6-trideoxy-beta-L-altropyranose hydrolase